MTCPEHRRRAERACSLLVGLLLVGCASALRPTTEVDALIATSAGAVPADPADLLDQAEQAFSDRTIEAATRAAELWLRAAAAEGHRVEAALGAVRAGIWIAGHSGEPDDRERASSDAVRAAQLCKQSDSGEVRCDYWLALALGVQARERRATALDALPRIVQLLENVIERQPALDHAGPHRTLALLYLRAPGWPTGPGDVDLGLTHARRAVALAPDYPPNQMCLAEGLAATDDSEGSAGAYRKASDLAREWLERGDPDAHEWLERSETRLGLR